MQQPALLPPARDPEPTILVNGASFAWESSSAAVLRSVNLNVAQGQLVMVVGEVSPRYNFLLFATFLLFGNFGKVSVMWHRGSLS